MTSTLPLTRICFLIVSSIELANAGSSAGLALSTLSYLNRHIILAILFSVEVDLVFAPNALYGR